MLVAGLVFLVFSQPRLVPSMSMLQKKLKQQVMQNKLLKIIIQMIESLFYKGKLKKLIFLLKKQMSSFLNGWGNQCFFFSLFSIFFFMYKLNLNQIFRILNKMKKKTKFRNILIKFFFISHTFYQKLINYFQILFTV